MFHEIFLARIQRLSKLVEGMLAIQFAKAMDTPRAPRNYLKLNCSPEQIEAAEIRKSISNARHIRRTKNSGWFVNLEARIC